MNTRLVLIGIGHKARHGKDYIAEYLQKTYDNVSILHFADHLYRECENKESGDPLIFLDFFGTLNILDENGSYLKSMDPYHPLLKYMLKHRLTDYKGMTSKDPELLQAWGQYKRTIDPDYWVKKTKQDIDDLINNSNNDYEIVLLPGTRHLNEYEFVKQMGGEYWSVTRLNEDGSVYVDPTRDPNHISETALDALTEDQIDLKIVCESGDLSFLERTSSVKLNKIITQQLRSALNAS